MKTLTLALAVAVCASCPGAAAGPARAGAGLKIVKSFRCPLPAHQGLVTVEPSGRTELVVMPGFDPREGRSTRQRKQLSAKDLKDLERALRRSGYEAIPDRAYDPLRGPTRTDGCSESIEITLDGKTKAIRYDSGYESPPKLDRLLKKIDEILDRHPWEEVRTPWEKPEPKP